MLAFEIAARRSGYRTIAGVDEAGRGPLAGPVVAAAVILKTFDFSNRIDDSKKLTARQRAQAFSEIKEKSSYSVGIVDETVIDEINIYNASCGAMERAVGGLPLKPDMLLIDGRMRVDIDADKKCIVKGDQKSLSIACASIIAKVTRDMLMEQLDGVYPSYGFGRHKGYGTKAHFLAIRRLGPCKAHRKTFQPIASILSGIKPPG